MLVSVIIPCFNVEKYIKECLDSVFAQTYQNLEVLCIDNNSTDSTFFILEQIKTKYPNLILAKEANPGAPSARNKGLSLAKGEWIQFLDADDLLMPSKIEHQVSIIANKPNMPFIAGACVKQNKKGNSENAIPSKDSWKGLFVTSLGITSANLFNRKNLESIGGWNVELSSSQEYDLMFRLLKLFGEPIIDEKPLTIIRERESGQISQRNPKQKWRQYLELRLQIWNYLLENNRNYFEQNQEWFEQEIFKILRMYSKFDLHNAAIYYTQYLGKSFTPNQQATKSYIYLCLIKNLGFKTTQSIVTKFT